MNDSSFDCGDADFADAVIAASHQVPVVVDFWAPWCQPCRILKPLLEKVIGELGGAVRLAKVNSDENPETTRRYGVRGIPAVKAFVRGALVDEFTGALPERQVRAFIAALLPSKAVPLLDAAQAALSAEDPSTASSLLADAEPLLRDVADRARYESLLAGCQLAAHGAADLDALRARVASHGNDLDARLGLAHALAAQGEARAACEQFLVIVQRDRKWNDEAGRKGLLQLFQLLAADPAQEGLVREFRIKLARTLN